MHRPLYTLLLCACALLAWTAAAAAREEARGGTFRMNISGTDVAHLDPALAFDNISGQVVLATCARLLSYPDRSGPAGARLRPEVAAGFPKVSRNGRTFTFRIRPGFRFNTGEAVTARSFVRALERALHPKMNSPALNFLSDIVGAQAYMRGKAKRIGGLAVRGDRLTIRIAAASPEFLNRLAMTFTCAVPESMPIDPKGVLEPPAAGPYYVAERIPGRTIRLERNPYYGGKRPANVDRIQITVNTNMQASYLQVERGEVDYDSGGIPAAAHAEVTRKYGINRGRYFVQPMLATAYLALNAERPLFADARKRRAVNYALNRRALVAQMGMNGGAPTDQILPPNMPGYRDARIYPLERPDLARARELAGEGGAAVLFVGNDPISVNQATIIKANLAPIGIDVEVRQHAWPALIGAVTKRKAAYDMLLIGWQADYADPSDFVNVLLSSSALRDEGNENFAHFAEPTWDRRMAAAARLRGERRYAAYARLDAALMRQAAPWAPIGNLTSREFVSARVGCYVAQPIYPQLDLAAVCLR